MAPDGSAPLAWLAPFPLATGGLALALFAFLAATYAAVDAARQGEAALAGDFRVRALGAGLTAYLIVRSPHQKPLVTSVAIAYELYLPAGVAGFGLTSGIGTLWLNSLSLLRRGCRSFGCR